MSSWAPNHYSSDSLDATQPSSQKAATMTVEPSVEAIAECAAITGCDKGLAARYLRVKQNDVNAAVNALFDGEDINNLEAGTTWDPGAFDRDREGVERGNDRLQPVLASTAGTRANSPAPSLGLSNPKTKDDEDRDIAAAIAASHRDMSASGLVKQETGVVGKDGSEVIFGPATRQHYEANQWALVPTVAQEILPDVPLLERRRQNFEPRILRHLPDGDYTPNLISICHAIPKAREAFLMRPHVRSDYGYDSDWWRGHPISLPRIVHTSDATAARPNADEYDDFLAECQRLMAFLDRSDRSYAATGALTQTDIIAHNDLNSNAGSLLELVLQRWTEAALRKVDDEMVEQRDQISGLFTTVIGTEVRQRTDTSELNVVDINIKSLNGEKSHLLELLDNLMWHSSVGKSDHQENYVKHPADVMVMRVTNTAPSATELGLEIPAFFHMDKYLKEHVTATESIRSEMAHGKHRVAKIEEIQKKLKSWRHPRKNTQIEAIDLLKHTVGHFSGANRTAVDDEDKKNETSLAIEPPPPHYADLTAKLERVISSIDEKLVQLAEEKIKTQQAIAEMSKRPPPGYHEADLQHRYTLRGVATKPNITYICQAIDEADRRASPIQDDDSTPEDFQWWRVQYQVSGNTARLDRAKAADFDVLRAVELEHNSALLVYANDDAGSLDTYEMRELPGPLSAFIDRDNESFARELAAEQGAPPSYDWDREMQDVRPSIERSGSADSLQVMGGGDADISELPDYAESEIDMAQPKLGYPGAVDPPTAEIHLPPAEDTLDGLELGDREVMDTVWEPLIPKSAHFGSDATMTGLESQDRDEGRRDHDDDLEK